MHIQAPLPEPYEVEDYEFHFLNGAVVPFTIARKLGDVIDFDASPAAAKLSFAPKHHLIDPDATTPSEEITVFMQHVTLIARRTRMVTPVTHEEKDLFKQQMQHISKTLQ